MMRSPMLETIEDGVPVITGFWVRPSLRQMGRPRGAHDSEFFDLRFLHARGRLPALEVIWSAVAD